MKTPKEWLETFAAAERPYRTETCESDIKAIQDEAFKAGLDAAEACIVIDGNPEVAINEIVLLRSKLP